MNRLKELREKENKTQSQLALAITDNFSGEKEPYSVSRRTLQYWESGEREINQKNAQKLAEYFGVSVPYLLGYSDEIMTFSSGEEFEKYRNKLLDKHKQSLIEEEKQFLEDFFKLEENDKQIIRYLTKNLKKKKPNN